jgi:hypothetical protein
MLFFKLNKIGHLSMSGINLSKSGFNSFGVPSVGPLAPGHLAASPVRSTAHRSSPSEHTKPFDSAPPPPLHFDFSGAADLRPQAAVVGSPLTPPLAPPLAPAFDPLNVVGPWADWIKARAQQIEAELASASRLQALAPVHLAPVDLGSGIQPPPPLSGHVSAAIDLTGIQAHAALPPHLCLNPIPLSVSEQQGRKPIENGESYSSSSAESLVVTAPASIVAPASPVAVRLAKKSMQEKRAIAKKREHLKMESFKSKLIKGFTEKDSCKPDDLSRAAESLWNNSALRSICMGEGPDANRHLSNAVRDGSSILNPDEVTPAQKRVFQNRRLAQVSREISAPIVRAVKPYVQKMGLAWVTKTLQKALESQDLR